MKTTHACLWLMACGASQASPPTVPVISQSELELWASEQGARPSDKAEQFLAPGGSFIREFELEEGCHLFFVVGAPGIRDADLALWSPEGEQLVVDEAPDAQPTVQLCGARRIFARVSAPAGAGIVTLHHFRSQNPIELVALGDGAATYEVDATGVLAQALAVRGYRATREWTFDVSEDDPVELGLGEDPGCFTLIAENTLTHVRVLSSDDEEARAAGDPAALQWCTSVQEPHRAHVEGDGPVRIRLYRATEEQAGGIPGLWLGDRSHAVH
jgi:hypothetical protein